MNIFFSGCLYLWSLVFLVTMRCMVTCLHRGAGGFSSHAPHGCQVKMLTVLYDGWR
jgi:hypothetical protein